MNRVEFEGKDLEEAIRNASSSLGIPQDALHYEIIEQGRRGVFGLGTKDVRIRVKPPVSQLSDREIRDGLEIDRREGPIEHAGNERRAGDERRVRKADRTKRAGPRRAAPPEPARAERDDEAAEQDDEVEEVTAGGSPELALEVQTTLQRIVDLMGLELDAEVHPVPGGLSVDLEGPDRKMLTSRDGELQQALQLLLNRMARRIWVGAGRISLAAEAPNGRRDDELVELTREVAQQVSLTGKTKKLHPMNAYERRLVHLTVREFTGLSSSSDGRGALKRVRISKVRNELVDPGR